MADTYYDGSFANAFQHGVALPSWDQVTGARTFELTMRQYVGNNPAGWRSGVLSKTRGPGRSVLVEESFPRDVDAGVIEWRRFFCEVPPARKELEQIPYNYQIAVTDDRVIEVSMLVSATVIYEYINTTRPDRIPVLRAPRIVSIDGVLYYLGQLPEVGAEFIIMEDSQVTKWRGNIYERRTPYAPIRGLEEYAP